ncbi:hypothetical protein O0881_03120 [Janthinobacterium sp. SUN100]|uniref:hypothetical protein n=1 Tax=Janthinobacterium sp. SUN100 TaxID=3004101 RepID=UPI0025B1CAF8|nr:hypothetical protein [Janthinobacterium sp. SUN100]MDN2700985.1 hypothetical protein [Janthinobacterium sp. SUN100]
MKLFSGYPYLLLISISALSLAGCAAPEPAAADGAPKLAAVKCKSSSTASLGTWIAKNCGSSSDAKNIDTKEFLDSMQTPGSIPGKP